MGPNSLGNFKERGTRKKGGKQQQVMTQTHWQQGLCGIILLHKLV